MDRLCRGCARRTMRNRVIAGGRAQMAPRSFSVSTRFSNDKSSGDSGVAKSGTSMNQAMNAQSSSGQPRKPVEPRAPRAGQPTVLRKVQTTVTESPTRRVFSPPNGQGRTTNPQSVLRRSSPLQPGQPSGRAGSPATGQLLSRTRTPDASGRTTGPGKSGGFLRRPGQAGTTQRSGAGPRGQGKIDPRKRRARKAVEEQGEELSYAEQTQLESEYIAKYVDPPPNPTEPIVYKPVRLTLEELKSDWPNTLLSNSGITESMVQKIEWLSRRLPHGYQSPEQIAEHYLKGNLTRFESEEEKQTVLKLASELTAKTKTEAEDGTLHKHKTPIFRIVDDPAFTSLASKEDDRGHIVGSTVKGDYGEASPQKFAFMQNAERILTNNETYSPVQAKKLLARVQSLIPQNRSGPAQRTKQT